MKPAKDAKPQDAPRKPTREEYERNRAVFLRMASWLMLVLSDITFLWYGFILLAYGQFHPAFANAILGILAFLLVWRRKTLGVVLAVVWSALQFIAVQVDRFVLDFVQVVSIHLPLENPLASGALVQIKVNFLAIMLFAVFVMNLDTFRKRKAAAAAPSGKK
jgi:hypothetical protein